MKLADFFNRVTQYRDATGQRHGQAMFNILSDHDHQLADLICSTDADPFYVDERIPKFIEILHDQGFITPDE
jgi:hypothetical protein